MRTSHPIELQWIAGAQLAGTVPRVSDAPFETPWLTTVAIAGSVLLLVTALVLIGIRRTSFANIAIVGVTLFSLIVFVVTGIGTAVACAPENLSGLFEIGSGDGSLRSLLEASALMFVAYTGYGRIATLGEEVAKPRLTIPQAMLLTLGMTMVLYLAVGFVAIAVAGAQSLGSAASGSTAPLLVTAAQLEMPGVTRLLSIGAVTAMTGVLLNLVLGLSRVLLAMARRRDMPGSLALISPRGTPVRATIVVSLIIGGLILIGDVRLSWSFSAFTVLVYYALTNLCATRIEKSERRYPAWISWCGLASCLLLALFIEWQVLLSGIGVIVAGLFWHHLISTHSATV